MKYQKIATLAFALTIMGACINQQEDVLFLQTDIFPLTQEHTHGATITALPNGDLLAAWFQGSGERQADDVRIMGARLLQDHDQWSEPFLMADVPGFPDINPVLFLDKQDTLWLVWYTVIANQWSTSLPAYRKSSHYMQQEGAPVWDWQQTLFVKPGGETGHGIPPDDPFVMAVEDQTNGYRSYIIDTWGEDAPLLRLWRHWKDDLLQKASGADMIRKGYYINPRGERVDTLLGYPYFRRVGWQTKNKPFVCDDGRIILPLYSDGFSFSLMAITDNDGNSWHFSTPLVGPGNIQPAIAEKKDGTLQAYMRDNGPPPKRLMVSTSVDRGETWSGVTDSSLPNEGSGADIVTLENGHWVLAYNDTEEGRYSLAISLSEDDGETWAYTRHLERDNRPHDQASSFAYPSIIEGNNGALHVVYSYHQRNQQGKSGENIRYARITEDWIREGDGAMRR